jgi:hypothetical protein
MGEREMFGACFLLNEDIKKWPAAPCQVERASAVEPDALFEDQY